MMRDSTSLALVALCAAAIASTSGVAAFVVPNTAHLNHRGSRGRPHVASRRVAFVAQPVLMSDVSDATEEEAMPAVEEASLDSSEEDKAVPDDEEAEEHQDVEMESSDADTDADSDSTADMSEASGVVEEESGGEKKRFRRVRHTLFVGNLPFDATEADVRDLFAEQFEVQIVSIPRDRASGQPRGFAFVDLGSADEMEAAVQAIDGTEFGGRTLRVTVSVPKSELPSRRKSWEEAEGTQKIYVGNIRFETTVEDLTAHFEQFGEVVEAYIPQDRETGSGRGFAFITMNKEDADRAIEQLNGGEFEGRKIAVSLPLPPGEKAPNRRTTRMKLYVGNLSFYTVPQTLTELFEEFGTVYDCFLPEDYSTGGSRGFGFVTMEREDGEVAVAELDGCELDGRVIRVNEAQPKSRHIEPDEEEGEDEEPQMFGNEGYEIADDEDPEPAEVETEEES